MFCVQTPPTGVRLIIKGRFLDRMAEKVRTISTDFAFLICQPMRWS
jgi:hypothetical protein